MTRSFRITGSGLVLLAFFSGLLAAWIWMQSNAAWRAHQNRAFTAGVMLFASLSDGSDKAGQLTIEPLTAADQTLATAGAYRRLSVAPTAARITNVPISTVATDPLNVRQLKFVILSPDLTYPLANLPGHQGQAAATTTGELARLLASYCSDPVVLAQLDDLAWMRIEGASVWGCDAAPSDRRLLAALFAFVAIAFLVTTAQNTSATFTDFAALLRARRRLGGPESYEIAGPQELQEIVAALNTYLETERSQLKNRAAVLSGVSHDLGTPATRLRLRTALVTDTELRDKLEAEIDKMTGIIESVLTYTRAEMNTETPRKLSLTSLVEAVVADYQDMGEAVTLQQTEDLIVQGGRSVFMSRQGHGVVAGDRQVIVVGRPVSLQRAITNLVDNALKYGRRATVHLETDALTATIVVEDEGSHSSAKDIEALMAPFQRGDNTTSVDGYGLGLTIVASIATLHGGSLTFEDHKGGLRARLIIQRG